MCRAPLAKRERGLKQDHEERLTLRDLANEVWILFARCVHSHIHDVVMDTARRGASVPKDADYIITAYSALGFGCMLVGTGITKQKSR